jgi:hypothetical protein
MLPVNLAARPPSRPARRSTYWPRVGQEKQRRSRPDPEARPRQYEALEAAPASTRGCLYRGGQRFESPPLHQEVRANRRDFPGSEIARHFRNLCAENRSLRSVWHVQATFLDAYRLKSLAAHFRFQGCCLLRVRRAGFRMAVGGREPRHLIRLGWMDLARREHK